MSTAEEIRKATGGYISAVPLQNVPGVRAAFDELLARVQALPFVPADWAANVRAAMEHSGSAYPWQPAPAIRLDAWRAGKTEPVYPDAPSWVVSSQEARVAWNKLADWWTERMQPILANWARNEADVLRAANADAAFWNGLYAIARPVAAVGEALIAAPEAVGNVVSKSLLGALRGFAPVLIVAGIVGIGFVMYKTGSYKKFLPK